MAGSHDKTDWILTKKGNPDVEVASSRNDTKNKTQLPTDIKKTFEVNTDYNLKVRYHDATYDLWSDYGSVDFKTALEFYKVNDIGVPGTANFGVGIAPKEVLNPLGLSPLAGTTELGDFQYGLYQGTPKFYKNSSNATKYLSFFKWIPKFYLIKISDKNDSQLNALLPYVNVSVAQMKEAQRRSPKNAFAIAPATSFIDEAAANAQGFILPRAFIDGGVEKSGFFISNTLPQLWRKNESGKEVKVVSFGHDILNRNYSSTEFNALVENFTTGTTTLNNTLVRCYSNGYQTNFVNSSGGNYNVGSSYDIFDLIHAPSSEYACCSCFQWGVISLLGLIQGQYATSTSQVAWYDPNLTTNFAKGINNNNKDINDSSVTISQNMDDYNGTVWTSNYAKTTHNGSITGISNVNGWLWQCVIGCWGSGDRFYDLSVKMKDVNKNNVTNLCNTSNTVSKGNGWDSNYPIIKGDLTGVYRDSIGISAYQGNNNTNEFGNDSRYFSSGWSLLFVGGNWDNGGIAGSFSRNYSYWGNNYGDCGFRVSCYPL